MHLVFVTAITKNYEYSKWIAWRHQAITFLTVRSNDIRLRTISQEIHQPTITNISFKIAHLNIQFNLTGANELKINNLPIKVPNKFIFIK